MKEKGKNNGMLVGFLIGIIVMILVFGGLYLTNVIDFKPDDNTNTKIKDNNNVKNSIKVDDSKDYVYDADYKYDNKYTDYSTGEDFETATIDYFGLSIKPNLHKLSGLKVPYININSADGDYVNAELKKLYMDYAKSFDEYAASESKKDGPTVRQILTYFSYKYNDIISVVVVFDTQATSPWSFKYKTYNFDVSTGNLLSYDEVLNKLNYNKENLETKMKDIFKRKMDALWEGDADLNSACESIGALESSNSTNCYDISFMSYNRTVNDNSIMFIVDNDGVLNVISYLYIPAQNGREYYLLKIDK